MRDAVRAAFVGYSKPFEGCVAFPYLDVKRLITVGLGELEDNVFQFVSLPFEYAGRPATNAEKYQGYDALRSSSLDPRRGGGQYADVTELRLTAEDIQQITEEKLSSNETVLLSLFPGFDGFCADAQLGLHSMAWALGAAFAPKWPKFSAAANAGDWHTCMVECMPSAAEMKAQNASFHQRVASWVTLFSNATEVSARVLDPDTLLFCSS